MPSRRFLDPPHAIAVEFNGRDAVVTFDQDLIDQPLAASNWVLHVDPSGTQVADSAAVVSVNEVAVSFALPAEALSLEYLATPPDVEGTNGLDVQAFEWEF